MGCISSKEGFDRSMSIHERFGQGVHALAIGVLPGDKDRIITLFKIASGKNLMRGFQYVEEADDQDSSTFDCNKPTYGRGEEKEEHDIEKRRPKIYELTELLESSDFLAHKAVSNKSEDPTGGSSATCRTFHTLQEFDELLEKINLLEPQTEDNANDGLDLSSSETDQTSNSMGTSSFSEESSCVAMLSQDNIPGWRKKAIARGLQSLMLPPISDETSKVGSLTEWIHAGDDIYSPESYVTPKFGSYADAVERNNFTMFSPELVAAFEECMKQMESEELAIVQLMEEGLQAN